jgi:large subunit ribosomal protein L34
MATKRTYQPHKLKRIKKFGFMSRNETTNGRKILKRRMLKGRVNLVNA